MDKQKMRMSLKLLMKARGRMKKHKPYTGNRRRIQSPESLKPSSDGKLYTTITVTGTSTEIHSDDRSPASPGPFVLTYAEETKEGGQGR